jgi:hypothetical protein
MTELQKKKILIGMRGTFIQMNQTNIYINFVREKGRKMAILRCYIWSEVSP